MASSRFTSTRARLAIRSRYLPPDHPELVALREELARLVVVQRITAVLDKSQAPLTAELRAEIDTILDAHQVQPVGA